MQGHSQTTPQLLFPSRRASDPHSADGVLEPHYSVPEIADSWGQAAYATGGYVDRVLKRNIRNLARGIFTLVVGSLLLAGLMLVELTPCMPLGKDS